MNVEPAPVTQSIGTARPVDSPCQTENAPCSPTDEKLRNHTLRRWLAYTPRRPSDPAPDDSWINECPCGNAVPCAEHGNLWRELRYTKPWDPDYAAAMHRAGIPFTPPDPNRQTADPRNRAPAPAHDPQSTDVPPKRKKRNKPQRHPSRSSRKSAPADHLAPDQLTQHQPPATNPKQNEIPNP